MENRIENAIKAEQERRVFYKAEQERLFGKEEITDVKLDFNWKNKACDKAIGNRAFFASQFVKEEGNAMIFKRTHDNDVTIIKKSWIKNLNDVMKFIG